MTLVSRDTEVVGDIKFTGELVVQGTVRGNIIASSEGSATVKLVDGGKIEGEIHAPKVVINGHITGDVHSGDHVELAAKAKVEGDVHYCLIEMVKGAQVNGSLLYAGAAKKGAKPGLAAVTESAAGEAASKS